MNFNSLTQTIGNNAELSVTRKQNKKYSVKSVLSKRGFSGKGYCEIM